MQELLIFISYPILTGFHSTRSLFSALFIPLFSKSLLKLLTPVFPLPFLHKQQPLLCPLGKPRDHKWLDTQKEREAQGIFHSTSCQVFRVGVLTTQSLKPATHIVPPPQDNSHSPISSHGVSKGLTQTAG